MAKEQDEGFSTWEEFLRGNKTEFSQRLQEIAKAPDSEYKFGPDGVYMELAKILGYHFSASANERRDQLLKLGLEPRIIATLGLDHSQSYSAVTVIGTMNSNFPISRIRGFVSKMVEEVEGY